MGQGFVECQGCHRTLKDAASRARGFGPVCWRRRTGPAPRRSRRPAPVPPAPDALPGQDQIALFYFQATLDGI